MDRARAVLLGLGVAAVMVPLASTGIGPAPIPWPDVVAALAGDAGPREEAIVRTIRLPRAILASTVGASLGLAGAAMQGLFRNPLADPSLIGVSSGAALGAVCTLGLLPATGVLAATGTTLVPLAAMLGGGGAVLVVHRLATGEHGTSVATMLLAGIAINALAGSGVGLVLSVVDDDRLRTITDWTLGSVASADTTAVLVTTIALAAAAAAILPVGRPLDALLLGEQSARNLGVDVARLERRLVAATALAVGAATAFAGLLGFVGLVVPHLLRISVKPDHRFLLPASALLGGALLGAADLFARTVAAPRELPLGVLTALLGAPFFLGLLLQRAERAPT